MKFSTNFTCQARRFLFTCYYYYHYSISICSPDSGRAIEPAFYFAVVFRVGSELVAFFFASSQLGLMGLLLALTFPVGCDSIKIKGPCFCYLLAGFFLFWSEICRCFPHFYRVALLIHPCLDWQTRRAVEEPSFTIDT